MSTPQYHCPRCRTQVIGHPMNGATWLCPSCEAVFQPWHLQSIFSEEPACPWPYPSRDQEWPIVGHVGVNASQKSDAPPR